MKIGIIGTGSMGSILIEAFLKASIITPSQLTITNRTPSKATALKEVYPGIEVVYDAKDVATSADIIFICVKPLQFKPLLKEISPYLDTNKIAISITSPISVEQLQSIVPCKVARIIPSISNSALAGSSLVTFGDSLTKEDQQQLLALLSSISSPIVIRQEITRVASDIASCGPAFFSFLVQAFIDGAVRETEITKEEATLLASEMMVGFGKLLEKEIFTLPTLQQRVCVPGGVTGEGIRVLEEEIGTMFERLFQSTHAKYYEDIEKIKEQF